MELPSFYDARDADFRKELKMSFCLQHVQLHSRLSFQAASWTKPTRKVWQSISEIFYVEESMDWLDWFKGKLSKKNIFSMGKPYGFRWRFTNQSIETLKLRSWCVTRFRAEKLESWVGMEFSRPYNPFSTNRERMLHFQITAQVGGSPQEYGSQHGSSSPHGE